MYKGEIWSRKNDRAVPNKDHAKGKFGRKKNNRTCTIIQYPRVLKIGEIHLHFLIQKAN